MPAADATGKEEENKKLRQFGAVCAMGLRVTATAALAEYPERPVTMVWHPTGHMGKVQKLGSKW